MELFLICTIIALPCLAFALITMTGEHSGTFKQILGLCVGILGITIYLLGMFVIAPTLTTSEIKTVVVCDKFTSGGYYSIATDDGNTYKVNYNIYGFIPKTGNATLVFTTDGFMGYTTITKIYSNTTCQAGCSG